MTCDVVYVGGFGEGSTCAFRLRGRGWCVVDENGYDFTCSTTLPSLVADSSVGTV